MALRMLVAANPEGHRRLAVILSGHDLVFVRTVDEAHAALAAGTFDLVLIGTRFDESRMFELVRYIRAGGRWGDVPIVCFRGILFRAASDKVLVEGLSLGCEALGAGFHDFISYPDTEEGNRTVRAILESHAKS